MLPLSLLLSKGKQIQTGAEWDTVVGLSVVLLVVVAVGELVPPGATEPFARAVADLLRDLQRRCGIGLAARERVWREFDWAHLVERAEAAYAMALARPVGSTP